MGLVTDTDEENYVDNTAGGSGTDYVATATAGAGKYGLRDGVVRPWTVYVRPCGSSLGPLSSRMMNLRAYDGMPGGCTPIGDPGCVTESAEPT